MQENSVFQIVQLISGKQYQMRLSVNQIHKFMDIYDKMNKKI